MSRETDSSSSGPRGRGGSSYPPGTEPYGTGGGAGESAEETSASGTTGRSEERRTETTLTTRIRINIPGSRPIPPVVMRTPVSDEDRADRADRSDRGDADADGTPPGGSASGPPSAFGGASGAPGPSADGPDTGAFGTVPAPGSGPAGRGEGGDGYGSHGSDPSGLGGHGDSGDVGGAAFEDPAGSSEFTQETSDWFAPRRPKGKQRPSGDRPGAPGPSSDGPDTGAFGTVDPYGTGSFPVQPTDTPADGFPSLGGYGAGAGDSGDTTGGLPRSALHGLPDDAGGTGTGTPPDGVPVVGGPAGPTTGPVTGEIPVPPARPGGPRGMDNGEPGPAGSTLGLGTGPAPFAPGGAGEELFANEPDPYGTGEHRIDAYGDDFTADTTGTHAVPGAAAQPGALESTAEQRIVGDPLVSGVPRGSSGGGGSPTPSTTTGATPAPASSGQAASGGGRSKLVLAGVGLVAVVGVAYGAGLLVDHADVPSGTTALGVDIGGKTRHDAVTTLNSALGDRKTKPFTVVANGKQSTLKPSVAGLTLDTEATVRGAAGRDYNPVSVIGSLFGAQREAKPALKLDKEKMASAVSHVERETGDGSSPQDGMIKFSAGRAVEVAGKPHKGIDPGQAGSTLEDAYRKRFVTRQDRQVQLPVSMRQPKVGKKELDRAYRQFAKPAMSGLVTVKAGSASIKFSPQKSLPKFLSMKPVNGTLVDTYDLPVLQQLYGTTFSGVKITRSDGRRTPVTPQDVAGALRVALKQTDPAKRVQRIPLHAR